MSEYDDFAAIYESWVQSAGPVVEKHVPFYAGRYAACTGPAVELGVGNGRILLEAARRGKAMVGVDSSREMLALCRARAEAAGLAERVELLHADFRDFALREPAELVAVPFHTLLHLVSLEDKRAGLRNIHAQLAPGGRLVFDCFVFDPERAARMTAPTLRGDQLDEQGRRVLVFSFSQAEQATQAIKIVTWTDTLDARGVLLERRYRFMSFSWLEPEQARVLLDESGFEVEACLGSFDGAPFEPGRSPHHIWVARR